MDTRPPVSGRDVLIPCGMTEVSVWAGLAGLSLCLPYLLVWPTSKCAALRARSRRSPWACDPVPSFHPFLNVIQNGSRLTPADLTMSGPPPSTALWRSLGRGLAGRMCLPPSDLTFAFHGARNPFTRKIRRNRVLNRRFPRDELHRGCYLLWCMFTLCTASRVLLFRKQNYLVVQITGRQGDVRKHHTNMRTTPSATGATRLIFNQRESARIRRAAPVGVDMQAWVLGRIKEAMQHGTSGTGRQGS